MIKTANLLSARPCSRPFCMQSPICSSQHYESSDCHCPDFKTQQWRPRNLSVIGRAWTRHQARLTPQPMFITTSFLLSPFFHWFNAIYISRLKADISIKPLALTISKSNASLCLVITCSYSLLTLTEYSRSARHCFHI